MSRSAILILSGGLGPTEDDVTRQAVAQALDRKLPLQRRDRDRFRAALRRGQSQDGGDQPPSAFVVEGAEFCLTIAALRPASGWRNRARWRMLLPGPPHELKAMFERHCLPRLARIVPKQVIRALFCASPVWVRATWISSSHPSTKKYENPVTTILAAAGDIQIHLRARLRH